MANAAKKPRQPRLRSVPTTPHNDAQQAFGELVLEDAELEEALLEYLAQKEQRQEIAQNRRARKDGMERHASRFRDGQRVRVGQVVFNIQRREGGDFEIPAWQRFVAIGIGPAQ